MKSSKEIMAENIKYYMNKKSITRQKLSDDLNIKYTTLASWLQADSYPRIKSIEKMAEYFGIDKSDLVEEHKEDISSDDLAEMLDNVRSYNGKPFDEHDKELLTTFLKGLYADK